MNAKIIDQRAIRLSQLEPGKIAIAVQPIGTATSAPYRPIYACANTSDKGGKPYLIELTDLTNQYLDKVADQDPLVIPLSAKEVVQITI